MTFHDLFGKRNFSWLISRFSWLFLTFHTRGHPEKEEKKNLGHLGRPMFRAPWAPVLGVACGARSFRNVCRVMRIPNMCLVLKLDNGKVVSIANRQIESQNHGITEPSSTVLLYRLVVFGSEYFNTSKDVEIWNLCHRTSKIERRFFLSIYYRFIL